MPARRAPGTPAGLTRERILAAALELLDRDGLAAFSMRRLGQSLGVEAMTLYHHVDGKDALLDGVVEVVLDEAAADSPATGWDAAMRAWAWSLRATLLRHPGVLPLVGSRPVTTPAALALAERTIALLHGAGFPPGRALDVLNALTVLVVGHTAAEARPSGRGSAAWVAGLDEREFPLLVGLARSGSGTSDPERFAFAVDALLAGFASALPT